MSDDLISRSALIENIAHLGKTEDLTTELKPGAKAIFNAISWHIDQAFAVDAVEVAELKEFAEDVLVQYGYKINCNGGLHITACGLSVLETAFEILGWEDPHPFPEGECEVDGCHEYATCGTTTPDGYKRVCSKHYAVIQARKEAENAKMDGGKDNVQRT